MALSPALLKAQSLHALAVELGLAADDAAEQARSIWRSDVNGFEGFHHYGRAAGLREAATLVIDLAKRELA